ncbi:MAG: hypothetical protein ACLQNE_08805 [Thermoguttaceae bacterium]
MTSSPARVDCLLVPRCNHDSVAIDQEPRFCRASVGRPGAEDDRKATVAALAAVVRDNQMPMQLRRHVMWMLSEIVKDEEITPEHVARGFDHPDLREDVRAALVRIPGENSLATLKMGFERASGEFKVALACSLRARGVDVSDPRCPKLVPTKETKVGKETIWTRTHASLRDSTVWIRRRSRRSRGGTCWVTPDCLG